jgi:hypothetical protein
VDLVPNVGGLAPAIPAALLAADSAAAGDPVTMLAQLGIGGALVAFAVWLQQKFTTEKNTAIKAKDEELVAERIAHDKTREVVIELLKQQIKDQERQ